MSGIYATIGRNVRLARRAGGKTQAAIASASGMSRVSIANLEAGRQQVSIPNLEAIAAALGVGIGDLMPATGNARRCQRCQEASVTLRQLAASLEAR